MHACKHTCTFVSTYKPQEPVSPDPGGAARALDLFLLGCQSRVVGECWGSNSWAVCVGGRYVTAAGNTPTPVLHCGARRWLSLPQIGLKTLPFTACAIARLLVPVGTTNLNLRSSRAHAIYTLLLSRRPASEPGVTYTSKLHIVDLAGSERCKRTKAEGEHALGVAGIAQFPLGASRQSVHAACSSTGCSFKAGS